MARLNKTVVAGGVVYPAGTAGDEVTRAKITNPAMWDFENDEHQDGVPSAPAAETSVPAEYDTFTVSKLRDQIKARNATRGDDEPKIEPAGRSKDDLVASLLADDARL